MLVWGSLSAVGVSSLILASQIAYDALRLGGAVVLIVLGIRSLLGRHAGPGGGPDLQRRSQAGWHTGLLTSISNPKLAAFFVTLLPQFLRPRAPVLPIALGMAATIVIFDVAWFSTLALTVEHSRRVLEPRLQRWLERITGGARISFGLNLGAGAR